MFQYKWNEIISHFIGIFEVKTEEARLRSEYDEFRAHVARLSEQPDLPDVTPVIKAPHQLGDADPGAPSLPYKASASPDASLDGDRPSDWTPEGRDGGFPYPSLARDGNGAPFDGAFRMPDAPPYGDTFPDPGPRSDPEGPTGPLRVGEGGSSVAAVAFQLNFLDDNDVIFTGAARFEFDPIARFDARLEALTDIATTLDPLGSYAPPSSDSGIADLATDMAEAALGALTPSSDEMVQVAVFRDEAAQGIRTDGAEADELPDWRDHMPTRLAPPERDADDGEIMLAKAGERPHPAEDEAEMEEAEEGEWGAAHQLVTGSNTLVNQSVIKTDWGDASVVAIMGDSRTLDVISQINVWSDTDMITGFGSAAPDFDAATVAMNAAAIEAPAAASSAGASLGASWSQQWPQHWLVDRMDGNLVNLNWARQTNYVTDHDVTSVSFSGNETWIQAGGNSVTNSFSAVEISRSYDLVVAEGDLVTANVIRQMNVLMDDDRVEMDAVYSGLLATRDNLLLNRAEIRKAGDQAQHEMAEAYKAAAADLKAGFNDIGKDILSDPAFEGLGLLRVLYVGGSILNMQYIEQANVLGDADQVTLAASRAASDAMADVAVSTGANALMNMASILDARAEANVHVRGEIYSDALLHQASLVSDADPDLAIGDPTSMASEAVAFLADGMLSDEDESGPVAGSGVSQHWDTPDVMQTMLS